ncbi:MAG: hypothetical protein ACR2OZ_03905 [Verrucomicrobiales bacterium]
MIETEAQFQQAIGQIERLYQGLDVLRRDILHKNPRNFAVLAEGPLDEIHKVQAEIGRYVSCLEPANTA